MMGVWEDAGGLCDLAIEGIRQCNGKSGAGKEAAWAGPSKAIGALEELLSGRMGEAERGACADKEFAAIERASATGPGWRDWGMSAAAWREAAKLLGAAGAAKLGLGRFAALAKGMVHVGYFERRTLRRDVGGKMRKIMRDGRQLWVEGGNDTPRSEAIRDRALAMHGSWCQSVGVLAESDWEGGVHDYGYGTWRDEFESGALGGPCMAWREKLLSACALGLERFGRLPAMPKGHGPFQPHWMLLENYAAHSAQNGFSRPQWQWCVQFPLAGVSAWDREALAEAEWGSPARLAMLDDPARGRLEAVASLVEELYGRGRELSELMRGQAPWLALLEAREMRQGLAREGSPAAPKAKARSL